MSKFIATLCAAAMLISSTSVVFADDTFAENDGAEFIEDPSYWDPSYGVPAYEEEYMTENNPAPSYDEPYMDYTDYTDSSYTGLTSTVEMIQSAPSDGTKEDDVSDSIFTDVPEDSYYANAVEFCFERGLFNGMTDTEFAPDVTMTRGMFATVFARIQKADLTNVTLTFADVKADAYYASYIAWATQEGIMDGYSDTAFGPDDAITREQAAKMIHAYLKNVKNISITDVTANYADMGDVSDWAKAAINANTSVGYLRTDESNNINPKAELTRADACFAVASAIKLVEALEAEGLKD